MGSEVLLIEDEYPQRTINNQDTIDSALLKLCRYGHFTGLIVVHQDGRVLGKGIPKVGQEEMLQKEDQLGRMFSEMIRLSGLSTQLLCCGDLLQLVAQCSKGNMILTHITKQVVLVAVVDRTANLGMALYEAYEGAHLLVQLIEP